MAALDRCYNIADLRAAAQRRLPRGVFEFVDRGSEDEIALRNNRAGFERIKLRHRALVDVSGRSMATTLFGKPVGMPMAIAPTGAAGLCWHEGELELAKAAAKAKIPFTLATSAMTSMEKIAEQAGPGVGGRLWFQLYVWNRRDLSYQLVERAKAAGFEALIVTVDTIVPPNREYNARNGFLLPFTPTMRVHRGHHAPPELGGQRAAEVLHHHRHAAQRELSGAVSPAGHGERSRPGRGDAAGFAVLGRHQDVSREVAGDPDAEGHQPAGRRGEGDGIRRGRHHRVEPWRAEHGQRCRLDRCAAG